MIKKHIEFTVSQYLICEASHSIANTHTDPLTICSIYCSWAISDCSKRRYYRAQQRKFTEGKLQWQDCCRWCSSNLNLKLPITFNQVLQMKLDLSVLWMLIMFTVSPQFTSLAIMPCCVHLCELWVSLISLIIINFWFSVTVHCQLMW